MSLLVRLLVGALCALGIAAGVGRTIELSALRNGATAPHDAILSTREQAMIDQLATLVRVDSSSPRYHETVDGTLAFTRKYLTYPTATLLHVIPGAIVLLLVPLQFSSHVRRRYLDVHRWSGRFLLLIIALTSLSALFLGVVLPYGGLGESIAAIVFGSFFLLAAARAFLAIRRGDVDRHRQWMIRMFATALGIATIRVVLPPLVALLPAATMPDLFAASLWIGWVATLALAEVWIRRS